MTTKPALLRLTAAADLAAARAAAAKEAVRVAKSELKTARKALKAAKKTAKQARRELEAGTGVRHARRRSTTVARRPPTKRPRVRKTAAQSRSTPAAVAHPIGNESVDEASRAALASTLV